MPENQTYSAAIAIIGSPNVGKSTLLNRILGKRVSIVSDKPQTTDRRVLGVCTRENRQLIFYDTPGIGKPIGERAARVNRIAEEAKFETDIILFVLDAGKGLGENDKKIYAGLKSVKQPIVLVINKMDLSSNMKIVPLVEELNLDGKIREFVPISAKEGYNVDRLLTVLFSLAPENPFLYGKEEVTDQPDETVVSEFIREQIFINSDKELPYTTLIELVSFKKVPDGTLSAEALIHAENARHRMILIGKGGAFIRNVRLFAQKRLKEYFGKKVMLELRVKVRKSGNPLFSFPRSADEGKAATL
jgi:GTP-binding protein Era